MTILAIGKYLKNSEIENRFDVTFYNDLSEPRQRLLIFKNENERRIVINIRQLSNDVSTKYLEKISDQIKKYICKQV